MPQADRRAAIAGWLPVHELIKAFHNPVRRHSTLGWTSPVEYENQDRLRAHVG